MNIVEAILLGIVQGVSEFIPVSSSGHLVLADKVFGIGNGSLAFDVALHAGTLIALVVVFWADIVSLVVASFKKTHRAPLAYMLVLATIPAIITGFLLEGFVEDTFRSPTLVAANLIIVAIIMLVAENWYTKHKNHTELKQINRSQALAIGVAQALAVVPGVSRSGSTITAGLFFGLNRVAAMRFSFLLGIPIILGALFKATLTGSGLSQVRSEADIFVVGIIAAFVSGIIAIKFMLRYLSNHSLKVFAYYRIAIGLIVLAAILI